MSIPQGLETSTLASESLRYVAKIPQNLARLLLQPQHFCAILHFLPRPPKVLAMIFLSMLLSLDMKIASTADIIYLRVFRLRGKFYKFSQPHVVGFVEHHMRIIKEYLNIMASCDAYFKIVGFSRFRNRPDSDRTIRCGTSRTRFLGLLYNIVGESGNAGVEVSHHGLH